MRTAATSGRCPGKALERIYVGLERVYSRLDRIDWVVLRDYAERIARLEAARG